MFVLEFYSYVFVLVIVVVVWLEIVCQRDIFINHWLAFGSARKKESVMISWWLDGDY